MSNSVGRFKLLPIAIALAIITIAVYAFLGLLSWFERDAAIDRVYFNVLGKVKQVDVDFYEPTLKLGDWEANWSRKYDKMTRTTFSRDGVFKSRLGISTVTGQTFSELSFEPRMGSQGRFNSQQEGEEAQRKRIVLLTRDSIKFETYTDNSDSIPQSEYQLFKEDRLVYSYETYKTRKTECYSKYDDNGYKIKDSIITKIGSLPDPVLHTQVFRYGLTHFDDEGNWVTRVVYSNGIPNPIRVENRRIDYYWW